MSRLRIAVAASAIASLILYSSYHDKLTNPESNARRRPSLAEFRRRALLRQLDTLIDTTVKEQRKTSATPNFDNSELLTRAEILRRIPQNAIAFATLANDAYAALAINWALLLLPILRSINAEGHAFIAALDEPLAETLLKRNLPTLKLAINDSTTDATDAPTANFRLRFSRFRAYGVVKADLIVWLLTNHRMAVISDVDCAWLKPPHDLLSSLAEADVLAGTDCLHVQEDADRSTRNKVVARCGHHPGSHWSAWFNTGVLFFRVTPNAIAIASEWRERMASTSGVPGENNCEHGCKFAVDDQLTFNQLVAGTPPKPGHHEPIYPVKDARPDGKVIYDGTGKRKIAALPATSICSGHVFHVQQGVKPMDCVVMHLTFVEAGVDGKYWRLREAGLYPYSPEMPPPVEEPIPQHDTNQPIKTRTRRRLYLSYTPPLPDGPIPPARHPSLPQSGRAESFTNQPHRFNMTEDAKGWKVDTAIALFPRLRAHLELVDRQLVALRNALAIARALNRELIIPKHHCLCERAQAPFAVLPDCVKDGASTPLPFVCPLEHILDLEEFAEISRSGYITVRPWSLLDSTLHPEAKAEEMRRNVTTVMFSPEGKARIEGSVLRLPPTGLSDREWVAAAGGNGREENENDDPSLPLLLHLSSAEGAIFGGFETLSNAMNFERKMGQYVIPGTRRFSGTWCCTHVVYQGGTILYKRPWPLPRPYRKGGAAEAMALAKTERRPCYWEDCRNRQGPRGRDDI